MNQYPPPPPPPDHPNPYGHMPQEPPPGRGPSPYQHPAAMPPPRNAKSDLMFPAIALIVVNIFGFLLSLFNAMTPSTVDGSSSIEEVMNGLNMPMTPEAEEIVNALMQLEQSGFSHIFLVINIGYSLLVIFGCFRVLKLKNFNLGVCVGVLSVFPCLSSCCCLIEIPLGIWLLYLLFDPQIRDAFSANAYEQRF